MEIDQLTDAQLSALLDGWKPILPHGGELDRRAALLVAANNAVRTGRLTADDIRRAVA